MPYESPLKLKIDADVRADAGIELISQCNVAVRASQDRDADLNDYDDLLEGEDLPGLGLPYDGACNLVDPLCREQHTSMMASMSPPFRKATLCLLKSKRLSEREAATRVERWLSDVWQDEGLPEVGLHYLHNLLRDKAAVIYAGWCEKTKRVQKTYHAEYDPEKAAFTELDDAEEPVLWEAQDKLPDRTYVGIPHSEDESFTGAEYRIVDLADFYLYPATSPSVERAQVTFERMLLSENDLLNGIDAYGYDERAVMDLIAAGPTHDGPDSGFTPRISGNEWQDYRERQNDLEGVTRELSSRADGVYECFLAIGKLPKLWESGQARLPKRYWHQNAIAMLCPARNSVFKLNMCPYPRSPYFMGSLLPKPNRAYGSGLVQVLQPLATESTQWVRATFNNLDHQILAEMVMDDESFERNKTKERFTGKIWREMKEGGIRPLKNDRNAVMGFEPLSYIKSRADGLFLSAGYGQVNENQPLVAEMEGVLAATDTKFDFYMANAFAVIPDLARWRVEMQLLFASDSIGIVVDGKGDEVEVTTADLNGNFIYTANLAASDSNDRARRANTTAKLQIQAQYFQAVAKFPQYGEQLWNAHKAALEALDDPDPTGIIGEKPQPQQQGLMPGMMPGMDGATPNMGGTPGAGMAGAMPMQLPPQMMGNGNGAPPMGAMAG